MAAPERGAATRRASLADYRAPLAEPLLDPRLVGRAAWSRCLPLAAAVPGDAAFGMLGLELRLGDDPAVDLLVCALGAAGGPGWLRTMAEARAGRQPGSAWPAISAFARTWCDGRLAGRIDGVWLEFDSSDRPRRGAELPVPSVFSSTKPTGTRPGAPTPDLSAPTDMLEALLADGRIPGPARVLTRIERALPAGSRIFQVGGMLGRCPPSVRVCVMGPGADAIRLVLDRLGWTGPVEEVERLLTGLGQLPRRVCLDLDVAPAGLGGTAGIEVYAGAPDEPVDASPWPPLLDRLERMNLATPAKRAALATYPRTQVSAALGDRLPREYARAATLLAAHRAGRFVMHLHHVKITVSPGRPPTAKAYLGFWHEWS
jgi:hypothetical protein